MKNKNQYLWFLSGVFGCCVNVFLYGETGSALSALGAVISFVSYSLCTASIYRRRKFELLLNR